MNPNPHLLRCLLPTKGYTVGEDYSVLISKLDTRIAIFKSYAKKDENPGYNIFPDLPTVYKHFGKI